MVEKEIVVEINFNHEKIILDISEFHLVRRISLRCSLAFPLS
jgi:hypothetical protein